MDPGLEQTLQELSARAPGWLLDPPDEDDPGEGIILSTRVRLARNLRAVLFPHRADEDGNTNVRDRLLAALADSEAFAIRTEVPLENLIWSDRRLLVERFMIGVGLAESSHPAGVAFSADESLVAGINEGDHLRLYCTTAGFEPGQAWERIDRIDDLLGGTLPFAFSSDFGYLTVSPTSAGTGLRASMLAHLPALVLTGEAEDVLRRITRFGMEVKGVFGEGSAVFGNLFRIANQRTLGRSEEDIINALYSAGRKLVEYENDARETLTREAWVQVADKVHRALGILRSARMLPLRESMNLLSAVRFGVNMGVVADVEQRTLEVLTILVQPSHLERREGRSLDPSERDALRAEVVRSTLE